MVLICNYLKIIQTKYDSKTKMNKLKLWTVYQNKLPFFMIIGLSIPFYKSYLNNCFRHIYFCKNIDIALFENWQGINLMGLSASLSYYKNKPYFINMKKPPTTLLWNKKRQGDLPNVNLCLLVRLLFYQLNKLTKIRQQDSDEFCWIFSIAHKIIARG